ncbi:MAG: acyl-CoA thioesterase [Bacteroidetes bacterium]|jgi:acyl-CoA thioester hydrolase|nr:acyl-CoA thioesterase [Bacteroidota bacterium]MBT5528306.1 acyl-CoA thioesterase [Cytophagia bacterium]MBT3802434.1 acyl-CoA thioesterase [Bacteroidota bacterium]MBT3934550.1 acyl-CoA thioesterase [Bacteroidota bacterium]MBT4340169.1 acyl-CoA thioesterase [Bacteroidota bacterium]
MFQHDTTVRVLYADTDVMGVVYYGNYPKFYEIGRTEMIRSLGMPYADLERTGIIMPVRDMTCNYIKSAHYDQVLTIRTRIEEIPKARMKFFYEIYNENKELVHTGETTLVFLDMKTNRPVRAPELLIKKLKPYFE